MKHIINKRWLANPYHARSHIPHNFRSLCKYSFHCQSESFQVIKCSYRSSPPQTPTPLMVTIVSRMVNNLWADSPMSFQHVYLVSFFRCTPDHLSLKYRCPFKMRYRIINIHLRNVEVVMVVVNHNYGFFFIHTCLVRIFVVLVDWKGGGINPEGLIKGNTTWWGVYSPKNNTQIS